jgi:hypothetical protein
MDAQKPIYGLMAEFDSATALVEATRRAYDEGYRKVDAYSPFPIEAAWEALHAHDRRVQLFILCGGIVGAMVGFGLCYWTQAIAYPLNIGGRPYNSWPAFIPVTFETTILFASLTAVVGMFLLNGLPLPYHPVFNVPAFARASQDGFFLTIESTDAKFDRSGTFDFLRSLNPKGLHEIEP